MSSTFIQFRVEESAKNEASFICKQLGIDLPTYMRICIARLNANKGIPFDMKLNLNDDSEAMKAMLRMSKVSEGNGNSDMSLEEINAEIAAARK